MKNKEKLLNDYIINQKKSSNLISNINKYNSKEFKEKVFELSENEKKIKLELNKLGYYIYFNSTIANYDLKKYS